MATVKPAGSEAWQDKLEGLDGDLSRVFHLLYESLRGDLGGAQAEELGLRKADRMAREDRTLILGMIERVALALDVPMPDVYIDRQREGIRVLPLMPPALGVSPSMMSGKSPRELIFHAARALYGLHPSRALASVYEPARLETLLMAAMERVCGQEVPALDPGLEASEVELIESQVSAVGEVLERTLSDSGREELGVLLKPYATGRTTPDVNRWILDAALARNHAALTCCGDVALALHLVRDDESAQLPIGRGDQLRSLVSFAVSEEHQLLRAQIHGASQPEVN